jgi:hypothetical protein
MKSAFPILFEMEEYEARRGWRTPVEKFRYLCKKKYPYVQFQTIDSDASTWLRDQMKIDSLIVQKNGGIERYLFFTSEADMSAFLLTWKRDDSGKF